MTHHLARRVEVLLNSGTFQTLAPYTYFVIRYCNTCTERKRVTTIYIMITRREYEHIRR